MEMGKYIMKMEFYYFKGEYLNGKKKDIRANYFGNLKLKNENGCINVINIVNGKINFDMNKLLLEKEKFEEKKIFSQKEHKIKSGLLSNKSLSPNRKRNIKNNIHKNEKNFKTKYSSENKNRQDKKK